MNNLVIFLFVVLSLKLGVTKVNLKDRPRITVKDGHLVFKAPPYKNITFETSDTSGVSINNIDLLTTLNKAHAVTTLTDDYYKSLSNYNDRLDSLEERLHGFRGGPPPSNISIPSNTTNAAEMRLIRKLRGRINALEKWSNSVKRLLAENACLSSPCKNGGSCLDLVVKYHCFCTEGWEGQDCTININECARFVGTDLGCQNAAICTDKPGSYECTCQPGWVGIHCTRRKADCLSGGAELCGHGTCVSALTTIGYKCICDQGWTTDGTNLACTADVDECKQNHPACSANPKVECINVPGSYYCGTCPIGYSGNGYFCSDINECEDNNGHCSPLVECRNTPGSRTCGPCPPGYSGDGTTCTNVGICNVNNGGCHPLATCRDISRLGASLVDCVCPVGYIGNGIGPAGCSLGSNQNICTPNPCKNGICTPESYGGYKCTCTSVYTGRNCDIAKDLCNPNPCQNNGVCQNLVVTFKCVCKDGYTGLLCTLEQSACGGLLKNDNGVIKYPSDTFRTYKQSANCAWTIVANDTTKVLNITFIKFDLEESAECQYDFLEIHDGRNTASPMLGSRFCGNKKPLGGNFTSTHNVVYIWFRSDNQIEQSGFEIMWNATSWKCGGVLTKPHDIIQSPGAPGHYPTGRDCWWRLSAPAGKRFLFTVYYLDIGNNKDCSQDLIQFFTQLDYMRDNDKFRRICNSTKPEPFYSPGHTVMIHFHSNYKDTYLGFQMSYSVVQATPGCGGVYTAASGYLYPPREATDMSVTSCEYEIQQPQNSKIRIVFEKFELSSDDCDYHYLEVFEGASTESPSVGRYCGKTIPFSYTSMGNYLTILYFTSDTDDDWKIKYERACSEKFTNESGKFRPSAFYSQNGHECIYQIERPAGDIIELVMKISTIRFIRFRGYYRYNSQNCADGSYIEVKDGDLPTSPVIGKYCGQTTVNITSTQNVLVIKLKLGMYYGTRDITDAFSAEYTSVHSGCGGILRKKFDHISSPVHVEDGYPPDKICKWIIIAPPNNIIKLSWQTFSIESSYECNYDSVQIFDNNTELGQGELMGKKYCGSTLPPDLFSSSNIMTVMFHSDTSVSNGGFLASYAFFKDSEACNINYGSSAGVLKSPGFPNVYPTNKECTYTITVQSGQQIMLNITDFSLELYPGCRYDWLEIRNGGTSSSPLIGKYCGTTIPKLIISHTNQLYLYFKSDISRGSSGFKIAWSSAATGCGGTLTSPTGSVSSPHYPEPYNRNTECTWKIVVNSGSKILVVFSDINLEKHALCMSDYVEIFDGLTMNSKSLGKFCSEVQKPIQSSGNKMLIKFRSDVNFQGRGFQLHYSTACRNTITGFRGVIESPNFPNEYPQDEDCLWEIIVPDKNKINITFSHFEIERSPTFANNSCIFDFVEVSYGIKSEDDDEYDYTKYGRYCGQNNPGFISLNSDHVQIHFVSDKLLLGTGFRLEWVLWGCGGHLTHNSGTIKSPNYPNPYPPSIVCEWLIEVEYGKSIKLEFKEIDIEKGEDCDFDHIKVYNGPNNSSNVLTTLCRQKKSSVISSTGNFLFLVFKSDFSYQGKGFTANYSTISTKCGGALTVSEGKIFSPNYPENYDRNDSCAWFIEVDDGHSIELTFEDVDIYESPNCSRNFVKVHDGPSAAYPVLKTLCGKETPNDTIKSTYNHMYVEFQSWIFVTSKGFLATYRKNCGSRIVTESSGIIELSYGEFAEYGNCEWTIVAKDPTKHVSLIITHMQGMSYCYMYDDSEKPVRIYNGESAEAPLIESYCGPKIPPTLVSDGSAITIQIESRQMSFSASYSIYDSHCGGTIVSEQGYFSTPGYPKKYPSDMQCEWIIHVPQGNHVSLSFVEFDIPTSDNCNTDYLEIRSQNSSGKLIGVYCGSEPNNITDVGALWLLFKSGNVEGSTSSKGFMVEFALNKENELQGRSGEIYSPLYPQLYTGSSEYSWKITVLPRYKILLTFKEFNVDAEDNEGMCYFASLEIYDGVDDTAKSLGSFCGGKPPNPIKSSSNILFIKAVFSGPRLGSKFKLDWMLTSGTAISPFPNIKNTSCGLADVIPLNNTPYVLTSPGFPDGYKNNLHCTWIFSTKPIEHIRLMFSVLNLDKNQMFTKSCEIFDRVKISKSQGNEGWELLREVCKKDEVGSTVISGNNIMKVEFITTPFLNGTGFKAYVYNSCGGSVSDSSGYIMISDNFTRMVDCQWNITVKSTKKIELTFEEINIARDTNNVCTSFLLVRNGKFSESPLLGKYCGTELPTKLKSSGNSVYIKFKGQHSTKDTFRLKYQEVSESCGGETVLSKFDNSTEIMSPNYPNIPQAHIDCVWIIRAPPDESLRIDFEERFNLQVHNNCETEYVELRDGGTEYSRLIGRYCNSAPSTQVSTGNMMYIKYFTDADVPNAGFKAKISISYCGGTIRGASGNIIMANLPANVPDYNCTWHIIGPRDHYLNIILTEVNTLCSYNRNNYNYVTITESDENNNVTTLGRYCGTRIVNGNLTTSGNEALIRYNGMNTGKFKATFKISQTQCGGTLNTDNGEIVSPGYPVMNHFNRRCLWKIEVAEGRRIKLEIIDLDFNLLSSDPYISVYEGDNFKVQLAFIRGSYNKKIIESSSNKMSIRFWSKEQSTHRGFKIKYTSNDPTICVGDFTKQRGLIANPISQNKTYFCEWKRQTNVIIHQTLALTITISTSSNSHACYISLPELIVNGNGKLLKRLCSTTTTPVVVRSPFVNTNIQARSGIVTSMNFSINYQVHYCGGIVTDQDGIIETPSHELYESLECAWLIQVNDGQRINLTTVNINLGDICENNFITVHNGDGPSHPRIGKFCKATDVAIVSQSKYLWIEYKWVKGSGGTGVKMRYEALDQGCGGILTDKSRIIQSPNYGKQYPDNSECLWEVHATEGYIIKFVFSDRFHIEESPGCLNDYLEIFDWKDDAWISLGKKCGRDIPGNIKSTSNKLRILFRTNDKISGAGFKARWDWHCGGTFEVSKTPRTIVSPGYPNMYENNLKCTYTIKSINSQIFKIEFTDFDIEGDVPNCEYDNVTITDGINNRNMKIYCANKKPPIIRSRSPVIITFKTDTLLVKKGFAFMYVDESCGGNFTDEATIEVTKDQYVLAYNSYNIRNPYSTKINCAWNITAPPNKVVVLNIIALDTMNPRTCVSESLSVYKDYRQIVSNRLAQLCSQVENVTITSDTGKMSLKLDAYPSLFRGFKALVTFSYGPSHGCGGLLNLTETKYIEPPNLENMDCAWKIVAPVDYKIQIQFTSLNLPDKCGNNTNSSSCDCSFIEVRDGNAPFSELIETICANTSVSNDNRVFTTSWNRGYLRLFLRGKKDNAFKVTLKPQLSMCGHSVFVVTRNVQTLTTPGYPNPYPPNTRCSYLFSTLTDQIQLHFIDFDLTEEAPPGSGHQFITCGGDKINIYENPNRRNTTSDDSLGPASVYSGLGNRYIYTTFDVNVDRHTFCGKGDKPFDYYSSGRLVTLTLDSTNIQNKGKGFKLEYSLVGCTRNYSETNARIVSGNSKSNCEMTITVPEGRTISLYFYRFFISYSANCQSGTFEVRDQSPTGKELMKTCGYAIPNPIFSLSNKLFIRVTHSVVQALPARYEFMYTSTEDGPGCGGELYSYRGKFYSPMYPTPFRNDTQCTWIIKVPVGLTTVLKFSTFDLQGSCDQTYVEVVTQPFDSTRKFCQGDVPGLIRSESSIKVTFVSSIHNGGAGWIGAYRGVNRDVSNVTAARIFP